MKETDVYKQVLDGKIVLNNSKEYIALGSRSNDNKVTVYPLQIVNILCMYLKSEITVEQLSEWASFLIASDIYVCPDWEDDEKSAKYEPMWYVLQQLSSPVLDGKITQEGVRQHLQILHKIELD